MIFVYNLSKLSPLTMTNGFPVSPATTGNAVLFVSVLEETVSGGGGWGGGGLGGGEKGGIS